jgi:hypothetical protein
MLPQRVNHQCPSRVILSQSPEFTSASGVRLYGSRAGMSGGWKSSANALSLSMKGENHMTPDPSGYGQVPSGNVPAPQSSKGTVPVPKSAKGLVIAGVACLIGWAFIPRQNWLINWHNNYTGGSFDLAQAHALCNSSLGQFGQALSATAAQKCGEVGNFYDAMTVLFLAGLVLLGAAAWQTFRSMQGRTVT